MTLTQFCSMNRRVLGLMLGIGTAVLAPASFAANFSVDPLKVTLTPQATSMVLTIDNADDKPLRLSVDTKAWAQTDTSPFVLTDTDDLIATPELVEVAPHSKQVLRVGTVNPPSDKEIPYRLLLTEIPNQAAAEGNGAHLTVRTQLSIPVFAEPAQAISAQPKLVGLSADGGRVHVTVANSGTRRMDAQGATFTWLSASGAAVATTSATTGYALAGDQVTFAIDAPKTCAGVASVRMGLSDPATQVDHTLSAGEQSALAGVCARAAR